MGIDGIGSGKPPLPAVGANPTAGVTPGESFEVHSGAAASVSEVTDTDRLLSGDLGIDDYLDARVENAVSHLREVLGPDQLELIKGQLREQLAGADPVLQRLLQQAGASAASGGDEA